MLARYPAILAAGCLAWVVLPAEPAEGADRVGFPDGYSTKYQVIRSANKTGATLLGTIYANDRAAKVVETAQLPYPNGSVIVMEWAEPLKDQRGEFLRDDAGLWRKGKVVRVDVMRREKNYGESYGENRAGEWEFATYESSGALRATVVPVSCAKCHQTATSGRDFVFRGRFPPLDQGRK
jgi:hypothetical protein